MSSIVLYSDINLDAGTLPDVLVRNAESLNQNIIAVLDTRLRSRWFRPTVGSLIGQYLFDPIDEITAGRISREMERALEANGENRIRFDEIEVVPDRENSQYFVQITYSAPELEDHSISFSFNLSRGFN